MSINYDKQFHTLHSSESGDSESFFKGSRHHLHTQNANKTFKWFATDQPERFNKVSGYTEADIDYKFNSDGYRCEELAPSPVLFLGCSYTFGVGIRSEETWPQRFAKHLGIPCMNVAYPGASIGFLQRTLVKTVPIVKPKHVIALIPYSYRFEFISTNKGNPIKVWTASGVNSGVFKGEDKERLYSYELFTRQENEDFQLASGLFMIKNYLAAMGIEFSYTLWTYENAVTDYFNKICPTNIDHMQTDIFNNHYRWKDLSKKARDSSHPAKEYHEHYSQFLAEKIHV